MDAGEDNLLINGATFATEELATSIQQLHPGNALMYEGMVLAARVTNAPKYPIDFEGLSLQPVDFKGQVDFLSQVWDIFSFNDRAIRADFKLLTNDRVSANIPEGVNVRGQDQIFLEEGAVIAPGCIINATTGPVYLGKQAEMMEGCIVRGPFALCDHAALKMGAKVYGATTIGDGSKVGGEVNNVIFFENSNKGHDGFLGNAVIGAWCNLGADTNCSNLKNNYDTVKVWHEHTAAMVSTGLQFCGLMMGDHSKCGINTMFNTGTMVGVSANIYGAGFPDKFIPSFVWGGVEETVTYQFEKAMETATRMMQRRGKALSDAELKMFQYLFHFTASQRAALK